MSNKNKIKENKVREIKFRALSNNTKDWVYGSLIKGNNYDFIITKEDYDNVVAGFDTLVCQCHPIEKDSKTISQFTGLYDKNGKEIYENDIVQDEYEKFIVKYGVAQIICCGCCYKYHDYIGFYFARTDCDCINMYEDIVKKVEVVGNIFDNPELLGEQQ